jgi:hypothetical protein
MNVETVKVKVLPDGRVPRADAARFLGLATATMAAWKSKGLGPRPRRVGGRVFYYLRDLEAFRDTGAREAD